MPISFKHRSGVALTCLALWASTSVYAATETSTEQSMLSLVQNSSKLEVLQTTLESFKNLAINSVDRPNMVNPNAVPDKAVVVLPGKNWQERPSIQAFGRNVVYLNREEIRSQMLINFIKIDSIEFKSENLAEVKLFYPYRAMAGTLKLTKTATGWQSDSSNLDINPSGAQLYFAELYQGIACRNDTEFARWNNAFKGEHSGQCAADPSANQTELTPAPVTATPKRHKRKH